MKVILFGILISFGFVNQAFSFEFCKNSHNFKLEDQRTWGNEISTLSRQFPTSLNDTIKQELLYGLTEYIKIGETVDINNPVVNIYKQFKEQINNGNLEKSDMMLQAKSIFIEISDSEHLKLFRNACKFVKEITLEGLDINKNQDVKDKWRQFRYHGALRLAEHLEKRTSLKFPRSQKDPKEIFTFNPQVRDQDVYYLKLGLLILYGQIQLCRDKQDDIIKLAKILQ